MYMIAVGISGKSIIATDFIASGTILFTFDPACSQNEKTYQTIQVGTDKHCLAHSDLALLNHSCNPSLIVDTKNGFVFTKRDVSPGEELNYFYPSTEWDMARPFLCNCGSPECLQYVRGAYWTPLHMLVSHYLNRHIVKLILAKVYQTNDLHPFPELK